MVTAQWQLSWTIPESGLDWSKWKFIYFCQKNRSLRTENFKPGTSENYRSEDLREVIRKKMMESGIAVSGWESRIGEVFDKALLISG